MFRIYFHTLCHNYVYVSKYNLSKYFKYIIFNISHTLYLYSGPSKYLSILLDLIIVQK